MDAGKDQNLPSGKTILATIPPILEIWLEWMLVDQINWIYQALQLRHYSETWLSFLMHPLPMWQADIGVSESTQDWIFCSYTFQGEGLWGVTDHEFGQQLVPHASSETPTSADTHGWMRVSILHLITIAQTPFNKWRNSHLSLKWDTPPPIMSITLNENREEFNTSGCCHTENRRYDRL